MKKSLLLTLFLSGFSMVLVAQTNVSLTPQNKIVILEEFTGINCPNCPTGHALNASLLAANPGQMFSVAYHPTNSSYTTPSVGQPDFRRSYPAAFYSIPYCGSSRFMPSAFINRVEWTANEKITGTGGWTNAVNTIKTQPSPVNVGIASSYNGSTNQLEITVQVYYTSTVTDANTVFVTLSENNIIGYQSGSGGSANYNHKHVFREAFTAQWGDPIANTTTGSMNTFTYTFTNTSYNMNNCDVTAFVYNSSTEEVTSGWQVPATGTTAVQNPAVVMNSLSVFPNPASNEAYLTYKQTKDGLLTIELINLLGKKVGTIINQNMSSGSHLFTMNIAEMNLTNGVYFIKLSDGSKHFMQRLVVE